MKYNIQNILFTIFVFCFCFLSNNVLSQYDEVEKLIEAPGLRAGGEGFGGSLDVEGDYAIVSVSGDKHDANNQNPMNEAGSVNIYKRLSYGNWTQIQKLSASDRGPTDGYGTGVVVFGDEAFISAPRNGTDSLGLNPLLQRGGGVFIYKRINDVYTEVQKIIAPDRNGGEDFGSSIDVSDGWLVVGATGEDKDASGVVGPQSGAVYIYKKNIGTGNWDYYQKIVAPNRRAGDYYGFDCSVDANVIVVGAPRQDRDANETNLSVTSNAGAAYAYRLNSGVWQFEQKFSEPNSTRNIDNNMGNAVDVSSEIIVVGVPGSSIATGTGNRGRVMVYNYNSGSGTWVAASVTGIENPNSATVLGNPFANTNRNGNFGFSLDFSEDKLLIGAPTATNFYSTPLYIVGGTSFLFNRVGNGFVLYDEEAPLVRVSYSAVGFSVAVDSNTLFVGSPGPGESSLTSTYGSLTGDSAGAAYIFEQCIHASVPQITPINSSICIGDSVQLVVNPNGSLNSSKEWYWYTGAYATGTLIDSTDTIWVKPTVTTTYSVAGEGYCVASNLSDSFSTVTVTVNPLPIVTATSTPGTTVCSGENVTLTGGGASTYIWDNSIADGVGFIPSGIGTTTYKVIGTDVNGCVDSTTIDVTVSNSITVGINYTGGNPICSGTSVTLSGTGASSYSWSPAITDGSAFTPLVTNTYTVTGTSASGCTATADTTITVVAGPNITVTAGVTSICEGESVTISATGADSYAWTGLGAGQSQNVTPLVTTTYVVIGTQASTMCTDIDSIEITVNPLPNVVATAQPNDSLCLGESLTLVSGAPNPVWNNGVFENVVFVPTLGSVDYIATSTDVNGCVNKDTVNVKVFSLPVVSASVSSPGAICSGDLVTLNGFGALSYVWDSSGIDIGILNGVPFMPSSGMNIFTVTGTDINGCVGTATQSLTVNESPSVSAFSSAGGLALCDGESVSLTATGNGQSYSWNNGVTDGVNFVPPVGATLYVVTATSASQCTSTAGITLVVNEQDDATITPVLPLCGGVPIETLSTVTSGGVWQGVGVNALTGEFDASVAGQGIHQIIYTTSGACDDADTINIEVYPELIVNTYGDSVCFGDQDGDVRVEVIQGLAPYTYLWYNEETTSAISDLGEGIYSIEVKDGNNCIVNHNVDVLLTESCDYHVFLPNVFSPNGDGSNDVFYARGKGFESLILVVYDRWGNKLFETTDKYLGWDGTKNGKPVDAGVYVYYVKAEYYDGTEEVIEGNVCVAY